MEINKNSKRIKALKIFGLFMIVVILMNVLMTYMVAKHSSGKELDILKKEIESLKYELKLANEENSILTERLNNVDTSKVEVNNDYVEELTEKTVELVTNKNIQSSKLNNKKLSKKNKEKDKFNTKSLHDVKHIEFPTMYYKDVEYDIISGKLKIPVIKNIYDEEIKKKVEETKVKNNKYSKYDIIIDRAKSYGRDVSYLDYEFLDYVFEEADRFNVNPYVVLGIVSGESNFYAEAKNKNSSATGLGQMIKGTGEYIHYNILGYKDIYNHNSLKDPRTSIRYMLGYFKYLKKYNSYDLAMGEYCGSKSYYNNTYRNKLLNNMIALGLTKAEANAILKGQIV